jgi:hypothetical protein
MPGLELPGQKRTKNYDSTNPVLPKLKSSQDRKLTMTPDMDRPLRARSAFSAISDRSASERPAAIAKNHSNGTGANCHHRLSERYFLDRVTVIADPRYDVRE